jgi:prepilin-type N-terminal cleavage/methylation domain-containing protein
MVQNFRNPKGFTLIELLIVVAVIGILAAIAIPVLGVYRMRSYNVTAVSDLNAVKQTLEAYYIEQQHYP